MPCPSTGNLLSDEILKLITSKTTHGPSICEALAVARASFPSYVATLASEPQNGASIPSEPQPEPVEVPKTIMPKVAPIHDPYSTYPPEERFALSVAIKMDKEAMEREDIWKVRTFDK